MSPPKRKKKEGVPTVEGRLTKRKPSVPTIYVRVFCEPLAFEAYVYEASPGNDGYMNSYKKVMKGELKCKYLTDALFSSYVFRRDIDSSSDDEILRNTKDGYWRIAMIRYPSKSGSTSKSRKEGLEVAKRFFQDKHYTDYPPREVETVDLSDAEDPPALDEFFLNRDIKTFIEEDVDGSELNEKFYEKHKAFACKCWSVTKPSDWALFLGFPA
jgi:hypothetical protein